VAAKTLKVDVQTDATAMAEFKTELGLMQRLHHPNIVQFLGACTKTKRPILITEFMYGSSLDRVFRDR
jgi:serine/threonine protein kinase